MTLHSKAIVLSKEDFGEADNYVQFLTEQWGIITVLAKAAKRSKRRYVGGLDLFCHDEIFLKSEPRGGTPYLLELSVLNSFNGLRDMLERTLAAGKSVQWVRRLAPEHTPVPVMYALLGQTLALMEKEADSQRLDLLNLLFRLKLLSELGLRPKVDACARCESATEGSLVFSLEMGGGLCPQCLTQPASAGSSLLGQGDRRFIDFLEGTKMGFWSQIQYPQDRVDYLNKIIHQFACYHSHARLPM